MIDIIAFGTIILVGVLYIFAIVKMKRDIENGDEI